MGLRASGELADAAFFKNAEETWACNTAVRQAHGIDEYLRYRDDILIIGHDSAGSRRYFWELKARAKYFKVICESVSRTEVHFLRHRIWKQDGGFMYEPAFKPTSLGVPLCRTSCHPRHVHDTWPVAFLSSMGRLSSNSAAAERAKSTFIQRLIKYYTSSDIVNKLRGAQVHVCRAHFQKVQPKDGSDVLWLPIGYHPVWAKALPRAVASFQQNPLFRSLFDMAFGYEQPRCRVAWRNRLPSRWLAGWGW